MGEPHLVRAQILRIKSTQPSLFRFICSSNNNIARITRMVKSLCTQYSPPLLSIPPPIPPLTRMLTPSELYDTKSGSATPEPELENYHPFPPPSRLSHPDVAATLRSLGFGYRADFIQKTAKMLGDAHRSEEHTSELQSLAY